MLSFTSKISIIGINPYVLLPASVLKEIFKQASKEKGAIPVRGTLDGHAYIQTLVKYSGQWRLYLNTPMRKAAKREVGDSVSVTIEYDPVERVVLMHPKLKKALHRTDRQRQYLNKSVHRSKKKSPVISPS